MGLIIFLFVGVTVFFFANVNVTLQPGESPHDAVRYKIAGKAIVAVRSSWLLLNHQSVIDQGRAIARLFWRNRNDLHLCGLRSVSDR